MKKNILTGNKTKTAERTATYYEHLFIKCSMGYMITVLKYMAFFHIEESLAESLERKIKIYKKQV